jgi:hypothetical protein
LKFKISQAWGPEIVLKVLIIAALFALFLLLVYSKLYPYIRALKKILNTASTMAAVPGTASGKSRPRADKKLVRCVSCGTWIPADRAIGTGARLSVYCSRECIEKSTVSSRTKAAS